MHLLVFDILHIHTTKTYKLIVMNKLRKAFIFIYIHVLVKICLANLFSFQKGLI